MKVLERIFGFIEAVTYAIGILCGAVVMVVVGLGVVVYALIAGARARWRAWREEERRSTVFRGVLHKMEIQQPDGRWEGLPVGPAVELDLRSAPSEPRRRCAACGLAPIVSTCEVHEVGLPAGDVGGWIECSAEPGTYHLTQEAVR